jgi:cold shock CspA family protein
MPTGIIKQLVHYCGQSARLQNADPVPTRNAQGYGTITGDGEDVYFEAKNVETRFDDLKVGQAVEYVRDKDFAAASSVSLRLGPVSSNNHAPRQQATATAPAAVKAQSPKAQPSKAEPTLAKAPAAKKPAGPKPDGNANPTLLETDKRHCVLVVRYQKSEEHQWRRVKLPQVETYLEDVSRKFAEPQVSEVAPSRCVVRCFDERAVKLGGLVDLLGDYAEARERCDRALLARFPADRIAGDGPTLPTW